MTQVIITLYDDHRTTMKALVELRHAGFDETQVETIESLPEKKNYLLRRLENGTDDKLLTSDEVFQALRDMEIASSDAEHYIDEINRGRHLVLVRSDDEISGRAKQILNQFPFEEEEEKTSYDEEHGLSPRR